MKKLLLSLSLFSFLSTNTNVLAVACTVSSKTFFIPRSVGDDLALQHACTQQFIFRHEPAPRFFLNWTVFYQASTNRGDLARYFFPTDKSELIIKGALVEGDRDISATWLQIAGKDTKGGNSVPTSLYPGGTLNGNTTRSGVELYLNEFSSKIRISPTYKSFGVLSQAYHNLDWLAERLWCSFDFPFIQVETETNLCESDIQNAATTRGNVDDFIINDGGVFTRHERARLCDNLNATQAFNNPLWHYGKISNSVQKLTGLADVQVKLGYNLAQLKAFRANIYAHGSLPTGKKPTAKYMFEPLIGNAGHWGIGAGTCIDVNFISGKKFNLALCTNLDYLYLISNTERRSMDLTSNGQWSRYLLVIDTKNEQIPAQRTLQPGINFFTRKVEVRPQHDINAIGSLKMGIGNFFIEGGYNLWVKSAESLCLKEQLPEGLAIAATTFGANNAANPFLVSTFSHASISDHIVAASDTPGNTPDAAPVTLASSDLNLSSATHPKHLTHKIFASTGIHTEWRKRPVQAALGASYEFANKNRSLDLWSVFLKFNLFI